MNKKLKLTMNIAIAAGLAATTMLPGSSATASPPSEAVFDDYIVLFPDVNVNRSVFINITAESFCDWLAGPPEGPPPAIDPVVGVGVGTGQGAVVGHIDADLYIELWQFDEDPSPLVGPCEDIQEQLDAGTGPWATGIARHRAKGNDVFGSGTRGVSFGDRTTAELTDADGNEWVYRNVFRGNEQCHQPLDGPPACIVDVSSLRQR